MMKSTFRLVQDMYRGCKTVVHSATRESKSFGVEVGLHQWFTKQWSDQICCMVQRPGQQREGKMHDLSKLNEDAQMDVRSDKEGYDPK